eukprot:m.107496 g.107496  ORF g.107496 m.107496 type:complete len:538 (+) comp8982_c0_seq3:3-1616(+)
MMEVRSPGWAPCDCSHERSCIAAAGLNEAAFKPVVKDGVKTFPFHVRVVPHEESASLRAQFKDGFEILKIVEVQNHALFQQFVARQMIISQTNGGIDPNEAVAYHVSKGSLESICAQGMEYRTAQRGFFGKGLYTTPDPMKANDYSDKGNPQAVRTMLRCLVTRGRVKEFEVGRFDRDLYVEPEGFDSVQGFIRRASEYVVYGSDRLFVSHIIYYKFGDTNLEMAPSTALPPNVVGHIVYITASLSEFFGKLQLRAGSVISLEYAAIRRLIGLLLKSQLTVEAFLAEASRILKAAPPPDLATRIRSELAKCRLPIPAGTVPPISAGTPPLNETHSTVSSVPAAPISLSATGPAAPDMNSSNPQSIPSPSSFSDDKSWDIPTPSGFLDTTQPLQDLQAAGNLSPLFALDSPDQALPPSARKAEQLQAKDRGWSNGPAWTYKKAMYKMKPYKAVSMKPIAYLTNTSSRRLLVLLDYPRSKLSVARMVPSAVLGSAAIARNRGPARIYYLNSLRGPYPLAQIDSSVINSLGVVLLIICLK